MECPKCQFENPDGMKFCGVCGSKLENICPNCQFSNPPKFKFCGECGHDLSESTESTPSEFIEPGTQPTEFQIDKISPTTGEIEGERKYITALFSDMSGYTAMSERLDPEEVKEITSRIFGEISKVVVKYDGFIEKFIGDAVMALFGVPKAHEDDPVRAIKAAREIHDLVQAMNPELEQKIEKPLAMHTGINTGLVVTGEVNMEKGTHGVAGDTINVASRLSSLANADEIIVGLHTCHQAEGHFTFEALAPKTIKGKAGPVQLYKVLSQKEKPVTIRRLSGLKADLIGRKVELIELKEAVENLREGKGKVFCISGDAGTGKSRLVEDLKSSLDLEEFQWREGHAYPYAQNIPYSLVIDLLNKVFRIEEDDPSEKVKAKVESGIEALLGKRQDVIPYLGSLYTLEYPELKDVSPELWKNRLQEAVQAILSALAKKGRTVFFLEDLHWADPSSVELIRRACLEIRQPAIVLCVYRPIFSLFTSHQLSGLGNIYKEIRLQDLSPSDAMDMLGSLLETESIPSELTQFVRDKVEGNPFYLEELVNSLIESETLVRNNGQWNITRPLTESDIPSSIHGLISGRLDRLENETKRILQEASVIGRAFLFEILNKVTELKNWIDQGLNTLERLDLIRMRSIQPDLEYMFKHPLTQEVVYNGLLKKERQKIHENIAFVMEDIFQDRISEFYETLAFHFSQGKSVVKAVDYLVKSGEKCLNRYAVHEAHQYYSKAYDILAPKENKTEEEKILLIDMLNSWGYVYYYLGENNEFIQRFNANKDLADSLGDKARRGMFYVWFGVAILMAGRSRDAYEYLCRALELGETAGNQKVIGYACTWLPWACSELGLYPEGIGYGERAQKIAESYPSDQYLYFKSLGGLCYIYFGQGKTKKILEGAKRLLDYGEKTANNRSTVFGHWVNGWGHQWAGDLESAQKSYKKAVDVAMDPAYAQFPKCTLCLAYCFTGQFQEAENVAQSIFEFSKKGNYGQLTGFAYLSQAFCLIVKGQTNEGFRMFEETQQIFIKNDKKTWYALSELTLGGIYSHIASETSSAFKKAEEHFNKAMEVSREIGAKGVLGQAYLSLGLLQKGMEKADQAREFLTNAIDIFEELDVELFIKQAKEALASIE
jgi:class 3 adenylate cyclase/tetratricopeptide (TPR) repeat protein